MQAGTIVRVKGDNVSALIMVVSLKTKGKAMNIVAREVALDIAAACYSPHVATHIPGISNIACDGLSRRHMPGGSTKYPLHPMLNASQEDKLGTRELAYYKSITPPDEGQKE